MAAIANTAPGYWFTGGGQGYSQITGDYAALTYMVRRELKKRGMLLQRAVLPPLANGGIGAGGVITAGYTRAQYGNAPPNLLPGGVQPVEQVLVHNSITTASDANAVSAFSNFPTQPVYQRNGDGNPRGNNGG